MAKSTVNERLTILETKLNERFDSLENMLSVYIKHNQKEHTDILNRIDNITKTNGVQNVKISSLETKQNSIQNELTEHKDRHWKSISWLLTLTSLVTGFITFLITTLIKGGKA